AALLLTTTATAVAWAVHAIQLAADRQVALDESERRHAENHLDRGLGEAERGEVALGMLWMARGLETIPPGADDLAWTIRATLAGWRRQLFALTNVSTPPPGKVLAFAPDGRGAWVVSEDGKSVRLWELARGQLADLVLEHPGKVTALAVSPDGRLVGTACGDEKVRLWNTSTGQTDLTLPDQAAVSAMAFGPDGRTVVIGRLETRVRKVATALQAWEVATGRSTGPTFHQLGHVNGLAFSPDGLTLLTITEWEKTVGRWEMPAGRFLGAFL